jgi:hypothetical protein
VRGLRTQIKYSLFTQFLNDLNPKPDVIFLSENWLDKHQVQSFFVDGYYLAASYGRGKKIQGGSLILVKEFLKAHIKPLKLRSVELEFEICGVKLEINNTKVTLVSLYRPSNPTANGNIPGFFDNLETFLEQHRGVNDIILAGDLNLDLLNNDANTRLLTEIFKTYNMSLLNPNRPTRLSNNINGGTLIDHIFTSIQNILTFDLLDYDCSDHKAIISALDLPVERPKDKFKYTRKFTEENWKKFTDLMLEESWQMVYDEIDIDEKSEVFMDIILKYFNCAFPLKKIVIRANQINKVNLSAATRQLRNRLLTIDNELKLNLSDIQKQRLRQERARLRKQASSNIRHEIQFKNDNK